MPNLVLDLLKYVFLAVLYIFVWRAVKAVYLELRPERSRRARATRPQTATPARPPARRNKKVPGRLAIIEGSMKGKSLDLGDEILIGRAEKCHLVLDDNYVSQVHARFFAKDSTYMVEDLGSTNGTYLNRRRITSPAEVGRGDQVKIGKTVMELRR